MAPHLRLIVTIFFCLSTFLGGKIVLAESSYPSQTVTIVVPTTAGGTADILGRLLAPKLSDLWGQPVIVENRPGAGSLVGTDYVARSDPDGYTLMITFNELATLPAVNKNTKINVVEDFERVGKIGSLPVAILANPKIKPDTLQELIAMLKDAPG